LADIFSPLLRHQKDPFKFLRTASEQYKIVIFEGKNQIKEERRHVVRNIFYAI